VDTGGTLIGGADASSQRTDELIVRALAAMRYDALNAGFGELRAGPLALRRLAEPSAPALISSNGRMASVGAGLICEVGGVCVGLVGVTSPNASGGTADVADLTPAVEALRAVLPGMRNQADLVVALADLEPAEVQELAAAGLDLQVVLGGRVLQCQALTRVGQTVVVAVGGDGRYVGKLALEIDTRGRIVSAENQIEVLGPDTPDDPDVAALYDQYR
jgi:2',3'-cyclic-nucleotide 2'-phosphodiesterase (5'-nucleotidase family)